MSKLRAEPSTYLGSPELHKRHSVMVEGGTVPRARVMNQRAIDGYLLKGQLTLKQHRAAEYLLQQAVMAGTFARGVNLAGANVRGGKADHSPNGIEPLSRSLRMVRKHLSPAHEMIVSAVVIDDKDVSAHKVMMVALCAALELIANFRLGYKSDPVKWIKRRATRADDPVDSC